MVDRIDFALAGARDVGDVADLSRIEQSLRHRLFGDEEIVIAGRYALGPRIGRGGAGVVYRAHDRELERDVAIKFVQAGEHGSTGPSPAAQARLLREAQAAAKLNHPNVVAIYDVGTTDAQSGTPMVFVAMELVEGRDLHAWLGEGAHAWQEIVDVFVAAGEGLMAAHAAGLVHRDFKLSNVLLGVDGRARVLDFGLARRTHESDGGDESAGVSHDMMDVDLTATGTVMGTPMYMAPEQHTGSAVSELSDQYSFCVALWRALYRAPPFVGSDASELAAVKARDEIEPPPQGVAVPRRIERALRRGLAASSEDRWPTMIDLLAELRAASARRRRWPALAAATAVLALALPAAWWVATSTTACRDSDAWLAGSWDDSVRRESREGFAASALPYASDSWARVEVLANTRADAWVDARREACERGEDDPLFDRRLACLDERRRRLAALSARWRDPDGNTIPQAVQAAQSLPDASACLDDDRLSSESDPAIAAADQESVAALHDELARVAAAIDSGEFQRAVDLAEPLVARADALGYPHLAAEASYRHGDALERVGAYDRALEALRRAYMLAAENESHRWAFASATELALVEGVHRAALDEAERWIRHAHSAWERGRLSGAERASLLLVHGMVLGKAGRPAEEEQLLREALALAEAADEPNQVEIANTLATLGRVLLDMGRYDEAQSTAERASSMLEAAVGSQHPSITRPLQVLGAVLTERGLQEQATSVARRAVTILEATNDPTLPAALNDLGIAYRRERRFDEAREQFQRAVDLLEGREGSVETLAMALNNLGGIAIANKQWREAIRLFDRAQAVLEAEIGTDDVRLAPAIFNRATPLSELGQFDRALADIARAQSLLTEAYGEEHPKMVLHLSARAKIETKLGRYDEAQRHIERSIEIAEAQGLDPIGTAIRRWDLAEVMWLSGKDPERARELARAAVDDLHKRAPEHPDLPALERSLRAHGL